MTAAPAIYAPDPKAADLTVGQRLAYVLVGAVCLAVLLTAAWLRPDPAGVGTHRQLGLGECTWLKTFGYPCASCGMTSSFADFAHGRIAASIDAQPMGTVLAALTAAGVWAGLYGAATGLPVHRALRRLPLRRIGCGLLAFGLIAWAWKIVAYRYGW